MSVKIGKMKNGYGEYWFYCCGKWKGGTYIVKYGYIFTCDECGHTVRGGSWVRGWLLSLFENYECYSRFRKSFNRACSSLLR